MSLFVGQKLRALNAKTTGEDLLALVELIEAGSLTPIVGKTYPLVEAPDAIRELERGHGIGKSVIRVTEAV